MFMSDSDDHAPVVMLNTLVWEESSPPVTRTLPSARREMPERQEPHGLVSAPSLSMRGLLVAVEGGHGSHLVSRARMITSLRFSLRPPLWMCNKCDTLSCCNWIASKSQNRIWTNGTERRRGV